ncbi:MAG: shikimate kinase [Candidatus Margulisiibacteriota bacterium]
MNIVLIGFMGSGKSVVGHKLASELGLTYIDTDQLIEEAAGLSISDIFAQKGEAVFRELETETIKQLQGTDGHVLATGGGMVLRQENVKMLKDLGPLVMLWAEPEMIYQRVKQEKHRPLLEVADPQAEIKRVLDKRTPVYNRVADYKVDTTKLSVNECVEGIIKWLKSR